MGAVEEERGNFLVYATRVGRAFHSFHELWISPDIPPETKYAKAADRDKFGDVYRPRHDNGDPFDSESYLPPCPNHVHSYDAPPAWHKDIGRIGRSKRRPPLLVGDPEFTFLWDRPLIRCTVQLPRGHITSSTNRLAQFLAERAGQ